VFSQVAGGGLPAGPQALGAVGSRRAGSDGACGWDDSNLSEPSTGRRAGSSLPEGRNAGGAGRAVQRSPPHGGGPSGPPFDPDPQTRSQMSATSAKPSSCTPTG